MTEWRSERLGDEHDLSAFDCGVPSLNQWLQDQAIRAQAADTARTFVWVGKDDTAVVAYYSISPTQVAKADVSGSMAGGHSTIPAYLLARLALSRALHGQGLGAELLIDALGTIIRAAESGAGRLIVVDAIDPNAAALYRRHDFVPVKGNELRLVMKVATARNALGHTTMRLSADDQLRLVSIVLTLPDGQSVPVVASPAEVAAIAKRLVEEADHAEESGTRTIDLAQIYRDVLGRDPFDAASS